MSSKSRTEGDSALGQHAAPDDDSQLSAIASLQSIADRLAVGSVFRIDDAVLGRADTGKVGRPIVIVVMPHLALGSALALHQKVMVAGRLSWKPFWGKPPVTDQERQALISTRGWAFSPRHSVAGFNLDGIFEVAMRSPLSVSHLLQSKHLGWLPRPEIEWILAQAGVRLPSPYPPATV